MPYKLSEEDKLCGVTYFDVDKHYSPIPKATCADIKGKCDNSSSSSNVVPFSCKGKTKEEILKELDALDNPATDKKEDKVKPEPKPTPEAPTPTPSPADNNNNQPTNTDNKPVNNEANPANNDNQPANPVNKVDEEKLKKDLTDFVSDFVLKNTLGFLDRYEDTFAVPTEADKTNYINHFKENLAQNDEFKSYTYEISIKDFTAKPSESNAIGETLEVSVLKDGVKVDTVSHLISFNENYDHL